MMRFGGVEIEGFEAFHALDPVSAPVFGLALVAFPVPVLALVLGHVVVQTMCFCRFGLVQQEYLGLHQSPVQISS